MKRRLSLIIALLLLTLSAPCLLASNMQRAYTVRDEVYRRVDALCRRCGVIGPSSFSPLSARGLEIALERIDPSSLDAVDRAEYEYLVSEVTERRVVFQHAEMGIELQLDVNVQGNAAPYDAFDYSNKDAGAPAKDMRNEVALPYRYELPFAQARGRFYYGDYLSLEAELFLRNNNHHMYESSLGWLISGYDGRLYTVFSGPEEGTDLSYATIPLDLPYRVGVSTGNDYVSFIAGRFPHSVGSGITGNLIIGDNFRYQEIATLSFLNNYFTYNISVTRFDLQRDLGGGLMDFSRSKFRGDQQFRVLHRFDVNILDRVRATVDFGTMFVSSTAFDLRFFYPFMLNHNLENYTNDIDRVYFDEANNTMGFSLEAAIWKGLSASFQFVLDQFQTAMEGDGVPSAYGLLFNLRYSPRLESGFLDTYFEFVYTNPYLYLNGKIDRATGEYDYNLDYIVGYHGRFVSDYGYSGYVHGPDSIVFSLGADYLDKEGIWGMGGALLYRIQGKNRLRHYSPHIDSTIIDMSGSIVSEDAGRDPLSTPVGGWETAEHLIRLDIYATYAPLSFLDCYLGLSGNLYYNYGNDSSRDGVFLPQATIGVVIRTPANYKAME